MKNKSNPPPLSPAGVSKLPLVQLVGAHLNELHPREEAFRSGDHGLRAQLAQRSQSIARRLAGLFEQKRQETERLFGVVKWPGLMPFIKVGIAGSAAGLGFLTLFSWLTAAQYVAQNFTGGFLTGLLFTAVVPVLPFVTKFFLVGRQGQTRAERLLGVIFALALVLFAFEFARHFAKMKSPEDTGLLLEMDGSDGPPPGGASSGEIQLREFFFAQLLLEIGGSYALYSMLLGLLAVRRDPLWLAITAEIQRLDLEILQLEETQGEVTRQITELDHRETAHQQALASVQSFLDPASNP